MNPYILTPDLNGEGLHIGIVRARFNEEIGQAELEACLKELAELGVDERDVMVATVPGALEVPTAIAMAEDIAPRKSRCICHISDRTLPIWPSVYWLATLIAWFTPALSWFTLTASVPAIPGAMPVSVRPPMFTSPVELLLPT